MKVFSREGMEMMDVKSIHREGDTLVLKGKVMGAMSTVMVVRPKDCWQAAKLLGFSVIVFLPVLIIKGLIQSMRQSAESKI